MNKSTFPCRMTRRRRRKRTRRRKRIRRKSLSGTVLSYLSLVREPQYISFAVVERCLCCDLFDEKWMNECVWRQSLFILSKRAKQQIPCSCTYVWPRHRLNNISKYAFYTLALKEPEVYEQTLTYTNLSDRNVTYLFDGVQQQKAGDVLL